MKKENKQQELHDDENPNFMFQTTITKLLVQVMSGEIDLRSIVQKELRARGFNDQGNWQGFLKAKKELWQLDKKEYKRLVRTTALRLIQFKIDHPHMRLMFGDYLNEEIISPFGRLLDDSNRKVRDRYVKNVDHLINQFLSF